MSAILFTGGLLPKGVCLGGGGAYKGADPPPRTRKEGSTHPTRMLPCLVKGIRREIKMNRRFAHKKKTFQGVLN